jgi:hypothetical protein
VPAASSIITATEGGRPGAINRRPALAGPIADHSQLCSLVAPSRCGVGAHDPTTTKENPLNSTWLTRITLAALLVALLLGALPAAPARAAAPSDLDLAFRWAPIHHQDTDDADADADFLTAVNFAGDWVASENWERQDDDPTRLKGTVYYSVVETGTHWFILYAFYHPRDWTECYVPICGWMSKHENDMEGALLIVRKDGTPFGRFEGMVTVFHLDFFSFTPAGSPLTAGQATIDGQVIMQPGPDGLPHPVTFQEARGHGLKAWDGSDFPGHDGVIYSPSKTTAEVPSSGNDRDVTYQLVDIFAPDGLWSRRFNRETFASWGVFQGDNGPNDKAHAPWRWDDQDDGGQLLGGELADDPATLVDIYFNGLGSFSTTYARNSYHVPAPTNLSAGAVTLTSVQLLWTDNATVETRYEVRRRPVGAATWTHTGLSAGAAYDYLVRACDAVTCSSFSNQLRAGAGIRLTVASAVNGRVTSSPAGITCGLGQTLCTAYFAPGAVVTLAAEGKSDPNHDQWWEFDHWEGNCTGVEPVCALTMSASRTVTAVFVQDPDGGF